MGEPQAFQARSAAGILPRARHRQPADRHAEVLRADDAAFRLGAAASLCHASGRRWAMRSSERCGRKGSSVSIPSAMEVSRAGRRSGVSSRWRTRRGELVPVDFEGAGACQHWARPETLALRLEPNPERVHILSPFDPLVCQRKRLSIFFDYEHRFEAYLPASQRVLGYFACPVLAGDRIVAALDLKTDRAATAAAGAEVDVDGEASAAGAARGNRGRAAFVRAVSAGSMN